jgi:hypothetical protein
MLNLSILIHTFNGYQFLWPGCLESWAKFPQKVPCYFGTDTEFHGKHDFGQFKVLYSGAGEWSDRLVTLLNKIETKYVLYAQEDHWPVKTPPDLDKMMQKVDKYGLLRLHLAENHRYYTTFEHENTRFFDLKSKYLVSHQPSIWDRKFLMECVSYAETPWINEYEGTKRLNIRPELEKKIAIHPVKWFKHTCVRGKLV